MTTPGPNPTRLELAQQLAAEGKSQEEILETLVRTDPARPVTPSWDTGGGNFPSGGNGQRAADRGVANLVGSPRGQSQATRLVEFGLDADLFHSPDGQAYAAIPMGLHRETWALKSNGFRTWLSRHFYQVEGKAPSAQALQDALGVLTGKAQFEGPEVAVHTRIAMVDERIYLDLANERWEAVEISTIGWSIVRNPPVKFRRPRGLLPLPMPEPSGCVEDLRRFANLPEGNESQWTLLVAWLLGCLRPAGPHPALVLHGEQGSAKSTVARLLRALVDPSAAPLRVEPKDIRDLMIAARNSWIIALDNISYLSSALSDSLCRLSTGGGLSTRELYSDEEEVIFDARRPVILNGIEEIATRADLLDRAVILYLPHIPEEGRRPESELWRDFDGVKAGILGGLLDAIVVALKNVRETRLDGMPRMADFALWVTAAEPALGWAPGTFLKAYTENREAANALALEASQAAPLLLELMEEKKSWVGSSGQLLETLSAKAEGATLAQRAWPKNARSMSGILRRLAPNLRAAGVQVTFLPRQGRLRPVSLEWVGGRASPASPSSRGETPLVEHPPLDAPLRDAGDGCDAHTAMDSRDLETVAQNASACGHHA